MKPDQRLKFKSALTSFTKKKAEEEVLLGNLEIRGVVSALLQPIRKDILDLNGSFVGLEELLKSKAKLLNELTKIINDKEKNLKKDIEELKEDLKTQRNRGTGASMYQAWITDSLSSKCDGATQSFTLSNYPRPNAIILLWNGAGQTITSDFTLSGNVITTIFTPQLDDTLTAIYPV